MIQIQLVNQYQLMVILIQLIVVGVLVIELLDFISENISKC
jgi:hypothetical protein